MNDHLAQIKATFPEPITSLEVIQQGWTNIVYDVNSRWIFRFVRDANNTQFVLERDFLPQFQRSSPVRIPDIRWHGNNYFAYPKIVGERFSAENFATFSNQQQEALLALLGQFLTRLHSFQYSHPHLSSAPHGGGNFWHDLWPIVSPALTPTTLERAKIYLGRVFQQLEQSQFSKTLIHADLGTNNIRIDLEQRELGGIIDFGDLQIGDPAHDFSSFYRNHDRAFVESLLEHYDRPTESDFWTRVEFGIVQKLFFAVYFADQKPSLRRMMPTLFTMIEDLFAGQDGKYSWNSQAMSS